MRTIHHTRSSDGQLQHILFDRTQHIIDYDIWHTIYNCTFAYMSYKKKVKKLHVEISMARWLSYISAEASDDDDHLPESKATLKDNRPAWIYIRGCGCKDKGKDVLYRFHATYGLLMCLFANEQLDPPPPGLIQIDNPVKCHAEKVVGDGKEFVTFEATIVDFCHIANTAESIRAIGQDAHATFPKVFADKVARTFERWNNSKSRCCHKKSKQIHELLDDYSGQVKSRQDCSPILKIQQQ